MSMLYLLHAGRHFANTEAPGHEIVRFDIERRSKSLWWVARESTAAHAQTVLGSDVARHAIMRTVSSFEVDMARTPGTDESSVVSMAEYDKRARRISGNTDAIAEELKKTRQATSLRLIETAERRASTPRLTLVESGKESDGRD